MQKAEEYIREYFEIIKNSEMDGKIDESHIGGLKALMFLCECYKLDTLWRDLYEYFKETAPTARLDDGAKETTKIF